MYLIEEVFTTCTYRTYIKNVLVGLKLPNPDRLKKVTENVGSLLHFALMVVSKFRWADAQLFFEDPIEMTLVVESHFVRNFPNVQISLGQESFGFIDSDLIDW